MIFTVYPGKSRIDTGSSSEESAHFAAMHILSRKTECLSLSWGTQSLGKWK